MQWQMMLQNQMQMPRGSDGDSPADVFRAKVGTGTWRFCGRWFDVSTTQRVSFWGKLNWSDVDWSACATLCALGPPCKQMIMNGRQKKGPRRTGPNDAMVLTLLMLCGFIAKWHPGKILNCHEYFPSTSPIRNPSDDPMICQTCWFHKNDHSKVGLFTTFPFMKPH